MMRKSVLLTILLLLLAVATPGAGQDVLTEHPPLPYRAIPVDGWDKGDASMPVSKWIEVIADPRYRVVVESTCAEDIDAGRWLVVFEKLAEDCRRSPWSDKRDLHARFQRRLDQLVVAFREAVDNADLDGPIDTVEEISRITSHLTARDIGAAKFTVERVVDAEAPDDGGGKFRVASLFAGTEDRILFTRGASGHTTDGTIVTMHRPVLDPEQMLDLRLRADTVRYLLTRFLRPVRLEDVASIHDAHLRWRNYLFEGYSQYPWEAAINGEFLAFSEMQPPKRQWIFGHPSIAVETETPEFNEMHVEEALVIEAFGHLFYNDDRSNYRGASAILCLRDEERTGVGALLHLKRGLRLGLVWRDVNRDKKPFNDNPSLIFSIDLYRHVQKHGGRIAETWQKLADRLETNEGGDR